MTKKIYCLSELFYQFDLETFLFGGGERWYFDFINLMKASGYQVECYQFSYEKRSVEYKGVRVQGLGNVRKDSPNIQSDYLDGYKEFNDLAEKADAEGVFYLTMNLCMAEPKLKTLCVSHGLTFDGMLPNGKTPNSAVYAFQYMNWVRNTHRVISVDTNSIKVMQALNAELSTRMTYIPNYVDLDAFTPSDSWLKADSFRVLFARRINWCKGFTYMMEAAEKLLDKFEDMEITFCGKGGKEEVEYFMDWYNRQDKNKVKYIYKDMSDMPEVYKNADVRLIPSIMAEGTSLSCIEGLAAGIPQIVTWVGGLTDIILQDYNGIIIPPYNSDAIVDSVSELYIDRERLREMRNNAIATAQCFSKEKWERDILKIIREVYGD
jgi:glycosyltransferase involved in cell wall biosynthesis